MLLTWLFLLLQNISTTKKIIGVNEKIDWYIGEEKNVRGKGKLWSVCSRGDTYALPL